MKRQRRNILRLAAQQIRNRASSVATTTSEDDDDSMFENALALEVCCFLHD